jgi:hypothetical protein
MLLDCAARRLEKGPGVIQAFLLLFLQLLAPPWRDPARPAALGAHLAPERQAAVNIAFALTDRAFSECHLRQSRAPI